MQIITACMLWGTYGLFVKKLGYSPEVIVFFRFLFGAIFVALLVCFTGGFARLKPSAHTRTLIMAGVINAASWLMFTYSINYTSVANGVILTYTAPCFVVLLAPFVLKERLEKKSIGALLLSFTGIILIVAYGGQAPKAGSLAGNVLGVASGLLYAFYILALKRVPPEFMGIISNFYISSVIAIVCFPLAGLSMPSFTLSGILLLVVLGALVQGVGTTLYMIGLSRVKTQHASILLYFEVVFATVFAFFLLHEQMTPAFLTGIVMVVAGCALILFYRREEDLSDT